MSRQGREFEQIVALIETQLKESGIVVRSPKMTKGKLSGALREIDVTLTRPGLPGRTAQRHTSVLSGKYV